MVKFLTSYSYNKVICGGIVHVDDPMAMVWLEIMKHKEMYSTDLWYCSICLLLLVNIEQASATVAQTALQLLFYCYSAIRFGLGQSTRLREKGKFKKSDREGETCVIAKEVVVSNIHF
eukprot:187996_1